jgi:predicted dehydrogenase
MVFGQGEAMIRTIHVGVGARGTWPVNVMGADPKFQPVALVDVNRDALLQAQGQLRLPGTALFDDLEAALRAVEADAVVICTPTVTHARFARLGFLHGKHVLVEKGMTMDWEEAKALVREAEQAGVRFCVAQNYRYFANMATIKQLLASPEHPHYPGAVQIVDFIHHRYRPEPRTLDYPYAMVWDMSCHHVDLLADWMGEARRVTALSYNTTWSAYEHDANITAIVEYINGAVCHYTLTHTATIGDWRIILQGERGALRTADVPGVWFYPRPTSQLGTSEPLPCEQLQLPASEQGVADDFYRYIVEGSEPGISGRNNLKTLAVCEMLVRSARVRRPVERAELD